MRRISFSASVLLVIVAGCAQKRQAELASIPVPLVSALRDDRGFQTRASPKYSVGQLPSGYPVVLVPTGPVRIVGGMTTGDETVAVFADSTRRLAAVMEQVFQQHGYVRPDPTPGSGFSSASGPYSYFCGDSGMVSVQPLAGSNRAFARVTYRPMRGYGSCRMYPPTRSADQLVLPELKPPTGVRVSGSSGGSGSDGVNSRAEMTGADLSASTILAHYAAQLVAAGWTAETPAVSQRVAAQYFEAKDASGGSWEGVLMASGSKTALAISLNMRHRVSR
jgi:hypothetical protein